MISCAFRDYDSDERKHEIAWATRLITNNKVLNTEFQRSKELRATTMVAISDHGANDWDYYTCSADDVVKAQTTFQRLEHFRLKWLGLSTDISDIAEIPLNFINVLKARRAPIDSDV